MFHRLLDWLTSVLWNRGVSAEALFGEPAVQVGTRGFAALGLGLTGDASEAPGYLMRHVESNAADSGLAQLRATGVHAVGLLGRRDLVPQLLAILENPKEDRLVRASAATAIGRVGDAAALQAVAASLRDREVLVRRSAAIAIGLLGRADDEVSVGRLERVLREESDLSARAFAAISLGRIGGDRAKGLLLRLHDEGKIALRPWALLGLATALREEPDDALRGTLSRALLEAGSEEERGAAIVALGIAGEGEATPILHRTLLDRGSSHAIRGEAALALGMLGAREHVRDLLWVLQNEPFDERFVADVALATGLLADRETIGILHAYLHEPRWGDRVRGAAILALGFAGNRRAVPELAEILASSSASDFLRHRLATSLGVMVEPERVPSRALWDTNYTSNVNVLRRVAALL